MPPVKRSTTLQLRDYLRSVEPRQRELLYRYLRTGRRFKELEQEHIEKFTELGLKILETRNRTRKKPYEARLSEAERKVVGDQARHLVELLYPKANSFQKKLLIGKLVLKTGLVKAEHVSEIVKDADFIFAFRVGRLFYDATKPEPRKQAEEKQKRKSKVKERHIYIRPIAGTQYGRKIILSRGWMNEPYERTTPFHEMVHIMTGASEYKVLVADYYYSLRHGITNVKQLRNGAGDKHKEAQRAILKATEFINLGHIEGTPKADDELRKFLKPPNINSGELL